ncbi:MAG: Sua5/YciO/YrdC/YwlC family protein [Bacteroidales bacterium]|nr:Sua5/YciO/YrdC/YwlC family protein [Bacteroidales bacterium]
MESTLIDSALEALRLGKTLLYPTDTIWGIGCDATRSDVVERIYKIKERDHTKSMLVLANEKMLSSDLPHNVWTLLNSSQPTTVILPISMLSIPIADNLPASDNTIGIRIPNFDFCKNLLDALGHPIVSTSANLSGKPSPEKYEDISDDIKMRVDLALPDDKSFHHNNNRGSRIVKIDTFGNITVLRP